LSEGNLFSGSTRLADGPVFIVEDDALAAMGVRAMLQTLGYGPLHVFASAEEALANLQVLHPRLVLMDIMLGRGMDGLAAAREVMAREPCPIVITTAFSEGVYVEDAMKAQVFGFLVKPITQRQLGSALVLARDRFERFQAEAARRRQAEAAAESERSRMVLLLESLPVFVCLIGPHHDIRYANRRFRELFGDPGNRLCCESLHGRSSPCASCEARRILERQAASDYEWPLPDGRTFHIYDYPFADVDGSPLVLRLGMDITERKRLEREIINVAQAEQQRIGRDLQDALGQQLTGISFLAKALEQRLAAKAPAEAGQAAMISQMITEAIARTRGLARGLSPVAVHAGGLPKALYELAADVERVFGLACRADLDDEARVSDEAVATHVYRIAQEAVLNAVRHARASSIRVCLSQRNGTVRLAVEDDGVNLPTSRGSTEDLGLRIMGYRARMIGGRLETGRGENGGTRFVCTFSDETDRGRESQS
jgi:signal transduction histidine kinase